MDFLPLFYVVKAEKLITLLIKASNITLRDLARIIANHAGKQVVFEIPDATETAGYSKAVKALLDGSKLKKLG